MQPVLLAVPLPALTTLLPWQWNWLYTLTAVIVLGVPQRALDGEITRSLLIPLLTDQYAFAQSRIPIDMMVHGCATSLFHASAQWSTMSS